MNNVLPLRRHNNDAIERKLECCRQIWTFIEYLDGQDLPYSDAREIETIRRFLNNSGHHDFNELNRYWQTAFMMANHYVKQELSSISKILGARK